jgi:hypothetical protein
LQYTLTQRGDDELRAALEAGKKRDWWLGTFGIFESVPRAILLAWLSSDLENAPRWLGHATEKLLSEASNRERKLKTFEERWNVSNYSFQTSGSKKKGVSSRQRINR